MTAQPFDKPRTNVFGKYVVTRRLGRGGMAEVFLARDPVLERPVAIKVIYPHLSSDPGFGERFCREAKVVASLRHPHIVQLYDFDVHAERDQPFMVLEYLSGGTLKDRLAALRDQGKRMPLAEIVRILDPIASALDYAHAHGAVHRDVKPANILFTPGGEPVLTDFGISKLLGESAQISLSGSVIGSPAYMSPEQAGSRPVSAPSDQYSLAVCVYEMATGRVPFEGESPTTVLLQHLNNPPPPPRQFNGSIPEQVQGVILKALAKAPAERFATSSELARAFGAALRGEEPAKSVVSTGAPTVIERPAAAPVTPPPAPAKPIPAPAPLVAEPAPQPAQALSATKPTVPPERAPSIPKPVPPPAPVKPAPRRSGWLACPVVVVVIGVLVAVCGIGALMLSGYMRIDVASLQPTSTVQVTATRSPVPVALASVTPTLTPRPSSTPTLTPPTVTPSPVIGTFGVITFAPGVMGASPNYKPMDAMSRFPEGVTKVYAVMPYEGVLKGEQWRYERYLDGKLQEKLGGAGWNLSGPGTTWVNIWNGDGITSGEWELRLYIADQVVQKGMFTIEKSKSGAPTIGILRFAEGIQDNKPLNPHQPIDNFKAGTTQVYAFFDASNMTKQTKWQSVWYRDEKQIENTGETKTWAGNPSEKDWWVRLYNDKGLTAGTYELKLYLEDKLVQLGTFVIQP